MTSKRPTESKDKPSSLSRRNLLKGAAIGGSSLILGKALAGQSTEKTTAMGNKRDFVGIDISPDYCKMAEERIKKNKEHSELNKFKAQTRLFA